MQKVYLTHETVEKLKGEIEQLKRVNRYEIAERVQVAREHGDLKENAEYHSAKEELEKCQNRINQLERKLINAKIINKDDIPTDKVYLFATVRLHDKINDEEVTYTIVPEEEADWEENKLSVDSPIGKGLLGKGVDEVAKIEVPDGQLEFKVLEITRE